MKLFGPVIRNRVNLVLSYEQETKLIEACRCEDRRHLWAMAVTAADTGSRFGELIALEKSQLNFGARFIRGFTNYKGKGGDRQSRDVAMTDRWPVGILKG